MIENGTFDKINKPLMISRLTFDPKPEKDCVVCLDQQTLSGVYRTALPKEYFNVMNIVYYNTDSHIGHEPVLILGKLKDRERFDESMGVVKQRVH